MGLELTTDKYPPITSQTRYPLRHAVFCPASEQKGPKGPLVTKNGGHVEYLWAIKKIKTKVISIIHF